MVTGRCASLLVLVALLAAASIRAGAAGESLERRLPPGGYHDVVWQDPFPGRWQKIDVTTRGVSAGAADVTAALQTLVDGVTGPTVLVFPAGVYHFGKITISRSNLILKGAGPEKTIFQPQRDGTLFCWWGNGGRYEYGKLGPEYQPRRIITDVPSGATIAPLADTRNLAQGDMVLVEEDLDRWSYDAARRGRGGVFLVRQVDKDRITLDLPLAIGLDHVSPAGKNAIVAKLNPVRNVGLEGVRIEMPDAHGEQTSSLFLKRVCNAYLRNVISVGAARHHVEICYSRKVVVEGCFFDQAKDKGPGGSGYGVEFRDLSTLCKAENNIFRDLRHAMATEVGVSYCVFAYNLNVDRVRDLAHSPAAPPDTRDERWVNSKERNGITDAFVTADVVSHGNEPHNVLWEGNVFYVGSVDHSHYTNGPNVFFRNCALGQPKRYGYWQEGDGFVIEGDNDSQVIVGNQLNNDSVIELQKHTYPRTSQGSLIAGNVVHGRGEWGPLPSTTKLPPSLYLKSPPGFWPAALAWPPFGPDVPGSATNKIPAKIRYERLHP